jgi:hypothetical protein
LATQFEPSPLTAEVSSLALNYASSLEVEDLNVVARSSPFSYLDLNHDGDRNASEPVGPLPVAGQMVVGTGRLILLADPSIFINTMLAAEDNRRFVQSLLGSAGTAPSSSLTRLISPRRGWNKARRPLRRFDSLWPSQ